MRNIVKNIQNPQTQEKFQVPEHSIVSSVDFHEKSQNNWVVNLHCSYVFSNALQFNVFEEIPLINGTYQNVEQILKNTLSEISHDKISELNLYFNDCHLIISKEFNQNIVDNIEDILSNLFQHLPHISKYEDMIPEVIYIPLKIEGKMSTNSCFKKWGLYYPNETGLIVYHLEDRSFVALDKLNQEIS